MMASYKSVSCDQSENSAFIPEEEQAGKKVTIGHSGRILTEEIEQSEISVSITEDEQVEEKVAIGHSARILTEEEIAKLEKDNNFVSEYKSKKFEVEAQKNWDLFYKRNTTKFFKDRHWTKEEFSELLLSDQDDQGSESYKVLEAGCGVGNFVFPLLEENRNLYFYACDFSRRAVQFVKEHPQYKSDRCHAFQCDITQDELTNDIEANSVDVATLIFVLSAIHPDKMTAALCNIYKVLKPGGKIMFRDYGLYDYAMLRFTNGHKLSENFYVRQDGTRAYYFSLDKLNSLMEEAGFKVLKSDYVQRDTVNKKEGLCVPRIFVQGRFVKPLVNMTGSESKLYVTVSDGENISDMKPSDSHNKLDMKTSDGET